MPCSEACFCTKCTEEEFVIGQILKWSGMTPCIDVLFTKSFRPFKTSCRPINCKTSDVCFVLFQGTQFWSLTEPCHIYYCTPAYVLSIPAKVCIIYSKVCIIYPRFSIHQVNNITSGNVVHLMYWELKIDLRVPYRWSGRKRVWWEPLSLLLVLCVRSVYIVCVVHVSARTIPKASNVHISSAEVYGMTQTQAAYWWLLESPIFIRLLGVSCILP